MVGVPERRAKTRQSAMKDTFCLRYFAFKHRLGLSRPGYSAARETGSIYHAIIAALHMGEPIEVAFQHGDACREDILRNLLELDDGKLQQDIKGIEKGLLEDYQKACAMAAVYWKRFNLDPARWKVIAVELPVQFELHVENDPLLQVQPEMTVDLVLYDILKGEVWIIDHKTIGYDPRVYQQTAPYDPQTQLYRMGVTAYIQSGQAASLPDGEVIVPADTQVTGMMYVPMKRPSIKQKKNQTFEEYLQEIEEWYTGTGAHENTTTGGSNALIEPYPHRFKGDLLSAEFHDQLERHQASCQYRTVPEFFPRTLNNSDCTNRYGKPCPFREFCGSHEAHWPAIRQRLFVVEPIDEPETQVA